MKIRGWCAKLCKCLRDVLGQNKRGDLLQTIRYSKGGFWNLSYRVFRFYCVRLVQQLIYDKPAMLQILKYINKFSSSPLRTLVKHMVFDILLLIRTLGHGCARGIGGAGCECR